MLDKAFDLLDTHVSVIFHVLVDYSVVRHSYRADVKTTMFYFFNDFDM